MMRHRAITIMATLSLLGGACGVQTDQRMEAFPATETVLTPLIEEVAESDESVGTSEAPLGLTTIIRCRKDEHGIPCMQRCADAGISCASGLRHPKKPDAGEGDLWECRAVPGGPELLVLLRVQRRHLCVLQEVARLGTSDLPLPGRETLNARSGRA
jgi:hypothetical protein